MNDERRHKAPTMRDKKSVTALAVGGLVVGLLLAELLVRLIVTGSESYGPEVVDAFEAAPERLLQPGARFTFNASGLYEGGGELTYRVSARRLIEPDPRGAAGEHVLFLGGSTTEALYVPEGARWVALLNDPPAVATHNAGVSGGNIVDAYHHLHYLNREAGLRPDLVVVMTMINDFVWFRRFKELGGSFSRETYAQELTRWTFARNLRTDRARSRLRSLREHVHLIDLVARAVSGGNDALDFRLSTSKAVDYYRQIREQRQETFEGRSTSYTDCLSRNELEEFANAERQNISLLAREVAKQGVELIVLTEPSALDEPPTADMEDFREPMPCGEGLLSFEDAQRYLRRVGERYMEAARWAGAETFDLAGALERSEIPANRLFYDGIHLTPVGCAEVARILRPVILDTLADPTP